MNTATFEELSAFQKSIKDLMDANTLIRVEDKNGKLEIVEESMDEDLQQQLREAWKRVYQVLTDRYADRLPHKANRM